jgi:hypothetical protein
MSMFVVSPPFYNLHSGEGQKYRKQNLGLTHFCEKSILLKVNSSVPSGTPDRAIVRFVVLLRFRI